MRNLYLLLIVAVGFMLTSCKDVEFSKESVLSKSESSESLNSQSVVETTITEQEASEEDEIIFIDDVIEENIATENEVEEVIDQMEENLSEEDMGEEESIESSIEENDEVYSCSKGKKSKNKKLMICHVPRGNPSHAKTLCLPEVALKAHIKDLSSNGSIGYMGPCK